MKARLTALIVFTVFGPLIGGVMMLLAGVGIAAGRGDLGFLNAIGAIALGLIFLVPLSYLNAGVAAFVTGLAAAMLNPIIRSPLAWAATMALIGSVAAATLDSNTLTEMMDPEVHTLPVSTGVRLRFAILGGLASLICAYLSRRLSWGVFEPYLPALGRRKQSTLDERGD